MSSDFTCSICGQSHAGLPDIAFNRPDAWLSASSAVRRKSFESDDACVIRRSPDEHFLRCVLSIPFTDAPGEFAYGPWAQVTSDQLSAVVHGNPGVVISPFEATLANDLPGLASRGTPLIVSPGDNTLRPCLEFRDARRSLQRIQQRGISLQHACHLCHLAFGDAF